MFTGLVESLARVSEIVPEGPGVRLVIADAAVAAGAEIGASIALDGCCLTVIAIEQEKIAFEAGPETLRCTTLGGLAAGASVNLETSLKLGDSLGGHLVTGHVDGVGTLRRREDQDEWSTLWFEAAEPLMRQMASKGSVTVAGVSLTLVDVTDQQFSVALIPHTLQVTTLGKLQTGDQVNLETDVLAKYVQRQIEGWNLTS